MAITAAELTTDFSGFLTPEVAAPIFERAAKVSVVQQVVPQTPLSPNGKSIPVVTGRMSAGWVDEGAEKPKSAGSLALKTITPKKIAAVAVNSAEVVRANPGNYMNLLRPQIGEAFAEAFDRAALHDEGPTGTAGGGPFATYIDQTTKTTELGANGQAAGGIWQDFVDSLAEIVEDDDDLGRGRDVTAWLLDSRLEPRILGQVDTTGHPLWVNIPSDQFASATQRRGTLLQRPSFMAHGVRDNAGDILGYGGDWTQAAWGVVGGITFDVSTHGTVTINGALVSLWENNLVAIKAEAEYGFLVNDVDAFVQLRNDTGS